jgi:hypothetical protein
VCGALAAAILALDVGALVRGYTSQHRAVTHGNWNGHRVHYRLFTFEADYEDLDRGLMWLARHAAPADIIASTTPHWVFLRTGLKAVFPPFERNVARANQLMDSVPVRYVVVLDWLSRRYALEAVRNAPSAWQVVYSNNHCTIYERMKTEGVASKGP